MSTRKFWFNIRSEFLFIKALGSFQQSRLFFSCIYPSEKEPLHSGISNQCYGNTYSVLYRSELKLDHINCRTDLSSSFVKESISKRFDPECFRKMIFYVYNGVHYTPCYGFTIRHPSSELWKKKTSILLLD